MPKSSDARLFYRCAERRLIEAEVLRKADQTTGAVYLAGYGVECIFKALILESLPARSQAETKRTFRGRLAHDLYWLRDLYLGETRGRKTLPVEVVRAFVLVADWSTELRYIPLSIDAEETDAFLQAVKVIAKWAVGRP